LQRRKPAAVGTKLAYPGFIEPALATSVDRVAAGRRWIHEIKFDGYRVQVHLQRGKVTAYTRRGYDWTRRLRAHLGLERQPVLRTRDAYTARGFGILVVDVSTDLKSAADYLARPVTRPLRIRIPLEPPAGLKGWLPDPNDIFHAHSPAGVWHGSVLDGPGVEAHAS